MDKVENFTVGEVHTEGSGEVVATATVTEVNTETGTVNVETAATTPSPEDMAAHDYKLLMPKFWKIVEPMSRRQEQRVFKALMEYPLEGGIPRFSYENEKEAFYLGLQIFDCKFVLMKAVMELAANKDKLDKFKADLEALKQTEGVVNDRVSSGLSGETSGGGNPS